MNDEQEKDPTTGFGFGSGQASFDAPRQPAPEADGDTTQEEGKEDA